MADTKTGSCLCGAVRLVTRGPLRDVSYCHCSQCRKQTGLYYASTNVSDADLEVEGADNVSWYYASKEARRGFCKTCGSALFWKLDGSSDTSIQAGAFDLPTGLTGASHIFCADKGDFYEITDGLPQYDKSSPDIIVASN
ncbi:GFA family protein [Pararhizobium sp.]|uniref:GFA family protein n=1 Tax=Pararhizobium sp. TaxID=1977563 RepID=UPI0027224C00|nr:GFA family protein [Pararhizobium sp.]MDO9418946.1 GFA family protein [Pararhizobium sp.]